MKDDKYFFDFRLQPGKKVKDTTTIYNQEQKPLISIITSYYNSDEFMWQTINCVLNQTFPYWEWIIVDDGSTRKESIEYLRRIEGIDKRIKVYHKQNEGLAKGRDYAIKFSKANYILPLDADDLIEKELGNVEVLDYDLFLYNKEEARIVGYNNEFISGPRLDNLECYYTSLEALIEGDNSENINVWAGFNNEEVGSGSNNGAGSTFLIDVINKVLTDLKLDDNRLEIFNRSMTISADNAHAIHPNHPEKSDPTNNVKLNNGIVIKYNSGLSYTSDAVSAGIFKSICNEENVPYQVYTNRSDLRGGGTLGSILLHTFSATSVDIGLAQLAMHSAYETAGTKDLEMMKKVLKSFYSRHLNYQNTQTLTIK